jgi:hypothetical protein
VSGRTAAVDAALRSMRRGWQGVGRHASDTRPACVGGHFDEFDPTGGDTLMTDPDSVPATPGPALGWAVCEFKGFTTRAGWVSEETRFGVPLLRLDVPQLAAPPSVELWSPSAIHRLRPCDEATARRVAGADPPQPALPPPALHFEPRDPLDDSDDGGPF